MSHATLPESCLPVKTLIAIAIAIEVIIDIANLTRGERVAATNVVVVASTVAVDIAILQFD